MSTTTRRLKMHNDLLLSVIKRQATTVPKAILEAVMNAREAGADRFNIDYVDTGNGRLIFTDNGKGIPSKEEIELFFETFGQPHDASEGKIWAQFRMGRGQIFSYGRTVWRTSTFEMTVDIKNDGLDYGFREGLEEFEGTRIEVEFYNKHIGSGNIYSTVDAFEEDIKYQIEFMPIEIFFNDKKISIDLDALNWTEETDDAYFLLGAGNGMKVYNMGAFVREYPPDRFGLGIVVSKEMLTVNFARTDIHMNECEVWQRIAPTLTNNRIKKTRQRAQRLDWHDCIATLRDLRDGLISWNEVKKLSLLRTSNGRVLNLETVIQNASPWTFTEDGNRIADRILESGTGLCINDNVLASLNYSGEEACFFDWLLRHTNMSYQDKKLVNATIGTYREFDDLQGGYSDTYKILNVKEYTSAEKRILQVLDKFCWPQNRRFCIGVSGAALAWTDGMTYIALERSYLSNLRLEKDRGAAHLIATIFHEFAHDCNTAGTHIHGPLFYETYHNLTQNGELYSIANFRIYMKNSRIEEKMHEAAEKQRQKEEKQRQKLLGKPKGASKKVAVAAKSKPKTLDIELEDDTIKSSGTTGLVRRKRHRRVLG